MKTVRDLEELMNKQTNPPMFGSAYNFLIERLADYLISKSDGKERVAAELKNWDEDAQSVIMNDVRKKTAKYM